MRILVAEDDPASHRLLKVSLRASGHEVLSAHDGAEALEILLSAAPPQLAILDWMMPELTGVAVCRKLREQSQVPYIYVVLVTANGSDECLSEGLHAGADDFLRKPYEHSELVARLHAGQRILHLQDGLIAAREQIRRDSTCDALTLLLNRGAIVAALEAEVVRASREGTSLSVVMADVDHFKNTNDRHGHDAGDAVLRGIAARVLKGLRPYDAAGRYGGEELLLILPGCDASTAFNVADRQRRDLAASPIGWAHGELSITASFGVATHRAGLSAARLITAADRAMYRAKHLGRNRTESADAEAIEAEAAPVLSLVTTVS